MRYLHSITLLFSLALATSSCEKDDAGIADPKQEATSTSTELYGKDWFDSRQPDSSGFKLYQSPGQTLPFGNNGFRFEANGTFVRYTIAPNDGIMKIPATWTTANGQLFHIKPNNAQLSEYDLRIEALQPSTLKAQIVP
ncbi:hypothetical protein MTX78_18050 [Hymenobacter tibetensis]|uniref:Uncharacterized protein n=1 Tax=Hymenobacter tibetensis TaxID=497967 RepID=A0ABY4CUR8_9BACT|nr:hypothetical protein [Hymenobacter tibetensis]UOG74014.1 hypothetical protein MTX78_18050 [Hymenobacter tibetensis]